MTSTGRSTNARTAAMWYARAREPFFSERFSARDLGRAREGILHIHVDHFNTHRPDRALKADAADANTPFTSPPIPPTKSDRATRPTRRTDPRIHPGSLKIDLRTRQVCRRREETTLAHNTRGPGVVYVSGCIRLLRSARATDCVGDPRGQVDLRSGASRLGATRSPIGRTVRA